MKTISSRIRGFAAGAFLLLGVATPVARVEALGYAFTTIDYPGAVNTFANDINNGGVIVGQAGPITGEYNSLGWQYSGGSFGAPIFYPGVGWYCGRPSEFGKPLSVAQAINDSGTVAGFYENGCSTPRYGFTETGGAYSSLSLPPDISTVITGINDAGVLVGSSYLHTPGRIYSGYVDNSGTVTYMDLPGASSTFAEGINDLGWIVGSYDNPGRHAFLSIGGSVTTIDVPGAVTTSAADIDNLGRIVGYYQDGSGYHGYVLADGVFTTIDDPLAVGGTFAMGINDAGTLVGFYLDGSGNYHGFVATVAAVPEPATVVLLGIGIAVVGFAARIRRSARSASA